MHSQKLPGHALECMVVVPVLLTQGSAPGARSAVRTAGQAWRASVAGKHLIGATVSDFRTFEELLRICVACSIHDQVSRVENSHHAVSLSPEWMPRAAKDGGGVAVRARQDNLCLASPSPLPSTCAVCTFRGSDLNVYLYVYYER